MATTKLNKKSENVKFSQEMIFNRSVGDLLKNSIKSTEGLDTKKTYICIAGVGELSNKETKRLEAEKAFNFKKMGSFLISNKLNIVSKASLDTIFNSDVYIAENAQEVSFVGGCREYNSHGITNIKGVITPICFIDSEVYEAITDRAVNELTAEIKAAEGVAEEVEKSAEEKTANTKAVKKTATKKKTVANKGATA